MKKIQTYFLLVGFAVIMLMPALLKKSSSRFQLNGVSKTADFPEFTLKGSLDGSFQDSINAYYSEHFPGRDMMIKLRNQVIFSLFLKSPNKNIVIGKDKVLFEEEYILKYEKFYPPITKEFAEELCTKLMTIQEKLAEREKEFYIFITPTKIRYEEEYVPDRYMAANRYPNTMGSYEMLAETLKEYPLHVYDTIPYINERAKTADFPLFYKTGTHWSGIISAEVTKDFIRYLNEKSRFTFPEMEINSYPVEEPIYPDADIFNLLNLLTAPYDSVYYQTDLMIPALPEKKPNLFCRGGSFMGQSIALLIHHHYFSDDTYIENTQIYRHQSAEAENFSSYEEIDLKKEIDQADIIILEVNEAHIPVMSFSLIDYILDHPELLYD